MNNFKVMLIDTHNGDSAFVTLRQVVGADGNHEKGPDAELQWAVEHSELTNYSVPLSLKGKAFNWCVLPAVTQGAEIWGLGSFLRESLCRLNQPWKQEHWE